MLVTCGDGLVGGDARHGDGVRRSGDWNSGSETSLAHNIRGLDFHDDSTTNGVINGLNWNARSLNGAFYSSSEHIVGHQVT